MSRCALTHPETGARCVLEEGHLPTPHEPEVSPAAAEDQADQADRVGEEKIAGAAKYHLEQARKEARGARDRTTVNTRDLRQVDQAVSAGRRGRRDDTPPGTYPVPPKPPSVCIYGCDAPALLYPCGPRCYEHSPAVARARLATKLTEGEA